MGLPIKQLSPSTKLKLANHLLELSFGYDTPSNRSLGICHEIEVIFGARLTKADCVEWKHFSGSLRYPVPDPYAYDAEACEAEAIRHAERIFDSSCSMWIIDQEYGRLRSSLCRHIAINIYRSLI